MSPVWGGEYRLAFVDTTRAISGCQASKQAAEIIQKKIDAMRKEASVAETEIKRLKEDLEKRKSVMSPEAHAELAAQVRQKYTDFQRLMEDNQVALDQDSGHWTKRITAELRAVIEEIGKEKNFTAIFGKGQVIYSDPGIDITELVLQRLNNRTKNWF
ncbi:MAG: OmpH family outer membrane protein [Magnetococcales bacterium]|nr:OmpH family outer membrane protein [Magnetococcales bacterium]